MKSWTKNKYLDNIVSGYLNYDLPFDFKLPLLNLDGVDLEKAAIPWQFFARHLNGIYQNSLYQNSKISHLYKLLIDAELDKVNWGSLCSNTNIPWQFYEFLLTKGIKLYSLDSLYCNENIPWQFFERHLDSTIYWSDLCRNPNIPWQFFERHLDKVHWDELCRNPNIPWQFFERHANEVWGWECLCENTNIPWQFYDCVLRDGKYRVNWEELCQNTNIPWQFFAQHRDKIDWKSLCGNTNIPWQFFALHRDKIDWESLCGNTNIPWQFYDCVLKKRGKNGRDENPFDEGCWRHLRRNTNIPWQFFARHLDKVDWGNLCWNTNIPWQFFEQRYLSECPKYEAMLLLERLSLNTDAQWQFLMRYLLRNERGNTKVREYAVYRKVLSNNPAFIRYLKRDEVEPVILAGKYFS